MGFLLASRRLKTSTSPFLHFLRRRCLSAGTRSSPCLMLPSREVADNFITEAEINHMDYSFYRLSDKQIVSLHNKKKGPNPIPDNAFCYGSSSNGWLLYGGPRDCTLILTNPLSPVPPTIPLPPVTTLSSVQVVENEGAAHESNGGVLEVRPPLTMHSRLIHKFAMSGSPDSGDSDCVVMVIQSMPQELAICKPGGGGPNPKTWLNLGKPVEPITQVVYSSKDKLFYTLNLAGNVETWLVDGDLEKVKRKAYTPAFKHPKFTQFEDWLRDGCSDTEYLVESSGEILLVLRYSSPAVDMDGVTTNGRYNLKANPNQPSRALRFDVYKLNELGKDMSWVHVKSLGERVLFLGMNERFSVSASDFPELKPNSIYFTDGRPCAAVDWGIYHLGDQTATPHYPCHQWSNIRPPPCWTYSSPFPIPIPMGSKFVALILNFFFLG